MYKANHQDHAIFTIMQLVVKHNNYLTKLRIQTFMNLFNVDHVLHDATIDTMLEPTLGIEERVATEMHRKKGTIIHDGWSKYGKQCVVLLAC